MIDRRRLEPTDDPMGYIDAMPPRLLLDRLPFPIAAVLLDGTLVLANDAFAKMLGRNADELVGTAISELTLAHAAEPQEAVSMLRSSAGSTVELIHSDGSTVVALVTSSVFLRDTDPLVLVGFADMTDYLWDSGRLPGS